MVWLRTAEDAARLFPRASARRVQAPDNHRVLYSHGSHGRAYVGSRPVDPVVLGRLLAKRLPDAPGQPQHPWYLAICEGGLGDISGPGISFAAAFRDVVRRAVRSTRVPLWVDPWSGASKVARFAIAGDRTPRPDRAAPLPGMRFLDFPAEVGSQPLDVPYAAYPPNASAELESRSDPRWGVVWLPQFLDRAAPTSELAVLFGDRVTAEYLARLDRWLDSHLYRGRIGGGAAAACQERREPRRGPSDRRGGGCGGGGGPARW